jgi:hypothetical protein
MEIQKERLSSIHNRLQTELPYYSHRVLKIPQVGGGGLKPLVFNYAQMYAHNMLEKQMEEKGLVRALILKARQMGFSTYVAARFYHKTTMQEGLKTFILSHQSKTTETLFAMPKRFYDNSPAPLRPELDRSNIYQMKFSGLDSEYGVGTAGSAEIGRGATLQLFHGSEVAFWENTDKLKAGLLQAVHYAPGTEMIFESTANGKGNWFHQMCMDAVRGEGDYILIFAPWFWHEEYARECPVDFKITKEEFEEKTKFNLTDNQIYWRRMKLFVFKNEADPIGKFRQEYPATVAEAFQRSTSAFILSSKVTMARKGKIEDPGAPIIMGVDPARTNDRIVFTYRQGRKFLKYEKVPHVDISTNPTNVLTAMVADRIHKMNVSKCFIDYGYGYGVVDNLMALGYNKIVAGVHFNEKPIRDDLYSNKRSEIYHNVRDWLHEGGVSIPDLEELEIDLLCVPDATEVRGLKQIRPKEEIKKVSGMSPDIFDAFALTFAYPVHREAVANAPRRIKIRGNNSGQGNSPLSIRRRITKGRSRYVN